MLNSGVRRLSFYMIMKNKYILTLIVFLVTVLCRGIVQAQTLVVWQKDGCKVYFSLNDQPRTTFTTEELVVTTSKATVSYPLSKILRYTYEDSSQSIDDLNNMGICIAHHGDDIIMMGLPYGKIVTIYSLDGKLLLSKCSDGTSQQILSLSQFPMGVYMIKAETVNYKFMKR